MNRQEVIVISCRARCAQHKYRATVMKQLKAKRCELEEQKRNVEKQKFEDFEE